MFKNMKPKLVLPKLSYTAQEAATAADLGGYASYAAEMRFKFISGETRSCGPATSPTSRKLGVDKLLGWRIRPTTAIACG